MNTITDLKSYDIEGKGLPSKVETVALVAQMTPLLAVKKYILNVHGIDLNLQVSLKSSYRSPEWEKSKGRSGYSEHTYNFLGATDLTFNDFDANKEMVIEALIAATYYTRIAIYNSFIHIDYKNAQNDAYVYNSKWVRQYKIER